MDFLKSIFDAWDERIRSPILGSILFIYLACNWRALFFLFFADDTVAERLEYFDKHTSLTSTVIIPLVGGLVLAWLAPWVKFGGAWVAKSADAKLSTLQENEASRKRIREYEKEKEEVDAKAALDAAREEAQLAKERRTKQAEEIGEGASERLQEVRATEDSEHGVEFQELDDAEQAAIFALGAIGSESRLDEESFSANLVKYLLKRMGYQDAFRLQTELQEAALRLKRKGLVYSRSAPGGLIFRLTSEGYVLFDELEKRLNQNS